jgi:hypothetical protein
MQPMQLRERGEPPQPPAIGNACAVAVSPERVTIVNAVMPDSRPEHCGFDEMRRALGIWIATIALLPQPCPTALSGVRGAGSRIVTA